MSTPDDCCNQSSLTHAKKICRAKAVVQRRKDCRQGPPKRRNQNPGDTSMDSAALQAVAVDSLLPPASSCKGLSASNFAVVAVSPAVGTIGSALFLPGRAMVPTTRSSNNNVEMRLPRCPSARECEHRGNSGQCAGSISSVASPHQKHHLVRKLQITPSIPKIRR